MCGRCWGPKFEIGGSKIDRMYADWLSIWQELTEASNVDLIQNQRREKLRARLRAKLKAKANVSASSHDNPDGHPDII